ncbi:hypothetical protein GVN21_18675 [Caulobacter sp. SLTY]|uniref:hypothetical protein n=1 Tax=Caulobacter sp. SLTY TaxID=2683262 RepID=UPI001412A2FA|nr:hypothetical protein [Caulobacter sp. SLTY]NBB17392.1 hypothetical protein [Caulobacter sp. SLTY]
MPADYRCDACRLCFTLGGYHYHSMPDGFVGKSLSVCGACGRQHAIEYAAPDRGPERFELYELVLTDVLAGAVATVARWLRRNRGVSSAEALEIIRSAPFVLIERDGHDRIRDQLDKLEPDGVVGSLRFLESIPNPDYGPLQSDRVFYAAANVRDVEGEGEGACHHRQAWVWLAASQPAPASDVRVCPSQLACEACGASDMIDDAGDALSCPGCHQGTARMTCGWIT